MTFTSFRYQAKGWTRSRMCAGNGDPGVRVYGDIRNRIRGIPDDMRGEGEMLKKLMVGAVAGFLLVGASDVMARSVDAWIVAGLSSASGTVEVEGDLCMGAVVELRGQGFQFQAMTQLEPRLAALFFQKSDDAVTLFCVANVFEEQSGLVE